MPRIYLGIDVGGTKITAATYQVKNNTLQTKSLSKETICTNTKNAELFLKQLKELVKKYAISSTIAIGIGFPGLVDAKQNIIHKTPNLPLPINFTLKKEHVHQNIPFFIQNDVNLVGLAEQTCTAPNSKVTLVVTMGTGVGGAIIINGQLFNGSTDSAAEFGHMIIGPHPHNPKKLITFENACSGTAIKTLYHTDGRSLAKAANAKDLKALNIWNQIGTHLGIGLSNLIHSFNPDTIIIGGSVSKQLKFLKTAMLKSINHYTFASQTKNLQILTAKITDSGAYGAALLAFNSNK